MYAGSKIVHEPATDRPERISGLQALIEMSPPILDSRMLWHRSLGKLLDGTRDGSKHPGQSRSETNIDGRTARSNRRAGRVEGSNASRGCVHRQHHRQRRE